MKMIIKKNMVKLFMGMMLISCSIFFVPAGRAEAKTDGITVINYGGNNNTESSGGSNGADTGVTDLDKSIDRGTSLLEGLARALGAAITLVGIVIAAIGFFGHQEELKAKAPITIFVGVFIYFAKEIMNFLLGK